MTNCNHIYREDNKLNILDAVDTNAFSKALFPKFSSDPTVASLMISALQNSKTNIVEDTCLVCGGVPNLGINDTSAIQEVQDSFTSQYMKSGVDEVFNKELHVWQIRFLKTFAYRK